MTTITKHTVTLVDGETVEVELDRRAGKVLASILGAAEDRYPGTSWTPEFAGLTDLAVVDAHLAWAGAPQRAR